ncbi:Fe-S cluster assembly protein SufD [Turicibacter sanguinis]|jgi:feS assembly protein sufD|uniref:Fe-S cluster assembly protein SufD n=1 Tax=Turicibacter sanguinis TaxID=154288 RepID=UPI00189AA7FF|nr:Fe-S cluster assembly protein SufD [Turicibacter sanguinis]MDB8555032.1 Fe-S cluster assembly protein SufD [Turicibacter sanguinis]
MIQLPTWVQQMQTEAQSVMPSLKLPKADRTIIKNWAFEAIEVQTPSTYNNEIPSAVAHLVSTEDQNVVILCDGKIVYQNLGIAFDGVIIANLEEALTKHEAIFKPYFMNVASVDTNRLTALHMAHLNSGLFIHVPKNKVVKEALNVIYLQENGSLFNHTLIVAEPNSEFKYIENYCNTVSGNINVISETVVKENAQVDYAAMDRLTSETLVYNLRKARVEANGRLLVSLGALNDGNTVSENLVSLVGQGAHAEVKTVAIAEGSQKQNITVNIEHLAPFTEGHIVNHGISKDDAQLTFNGIGKIHKGMNGSNAQQESRAMILSETARADANPILLIDEYDVKAGHAAGVGKIDEEQLYYLMSRGLTRRAAEVLIIYGFLMPFIDEICNESIKAEFEKVIARKINA